MTKKCFLHLFFVMVCAPMLWLHNGCSSARAAEHKNVEEEQQPAKSVVLIGLGIMGRAIAQCYSDHGYQVHAWNRGATNRDRVRDMNLSNVFLYEDLREALHQSPPGSLVLMMVVADEGLATANSILQQSTTMDDPTLWKGKTLVQFTSQEPFAIKEQEQLVTTKLGANLIGGAMLGVSDHVCTDKSFFLVSAADEARLNETVPYLQPLGTVVPFNGDVGLASLADIGLLQAMQFGLAGNELSCALFQKYGVDAAFQDTYVKLIPQTTIPLIEYLSQEAALAIFRNHFKDQAANTYTAATHRSVYETHQSFFERMGLHQPTYLSQYLEQFRKVPNSNTEGPSAIVNTYIFSSEVNNDKEEL